MAKHIWNVSCWSVKTREEFGVLKDVALRMDYSDDEANGLALYHIEQSRQRFSVWVHPSNLTSLQNSFKRTRKETIKKYSDLYEMWKKKLAVCPV